MAYDLELRGFLFPEDPSLYYMTGVEQGYYAGMQCVMARIEEAIEVHSQYEDSDFHEKACELRVLSSLRDQTLHMDAAFRGENKNANTMKELARIKTLFFWVKLKSLSLGDVWPKIRKFLCDLEDNPMPTKYKKRIFMDMWDAFGYNLRFDNAPHGSIILGPELCIF
jgi:hypothetical protein